MWVLGLGGSNHDYSSCLVKDGAIQCMIEEERITRKKHGVGLGIELVKGLSWRYCLRECAIDLQDVDLIVGNDILTRTLYHRIDREIILINHHLAHAASAYYTSDFDESAILIVDAVGSKISQSDHSQYESTTFAYGHGKEIQTLHKQLGSVVAGTDYIENSLGTFYSIITEIIGFGEHEEGKTMGLAPYGTDHMYNELQQYVKIGDHGTITITQSDIAALLQYKALVDAVTNEQQRFSLKADIAFAAQCILEEVMLSFCSHLATLTNSRNLCIAGGVGLNSVANYKILKRNLFDHLYLQPAAGDNGTSIGCALYGYHSLMSRAQAVG